MVTRPFFKFPSIDPEVYLVAEITGWDTLGFVDGIANISFNGNDVGKSVIKFSESKDTLLLSVGKDNSVYLKRSEIVDQKYFKTASIGKKRKTTQAYSFELKNNNSFPITFELRDQVPISQTKTADVDIETTSSGNLNDETGEVSWILDLQPRQSIDKELVFTIVSEGQYSYRYNQSTPRMRQMKCPEF